ncbi:MAG: NAD(P)H-dependent oxidoreductase subunit E [Caldiserica bacterium]|jgi:NADH:ubiquinone oxidoreductase subunit E|nr:NAD(P)H-dependent oxidoreductase subunit E [Caldisericota bacterium]MDH7562076.1 NAD(P)H-dependent oxidoreductase subunit E [Caldisericota bacterium]
MEKIRVLKRFEPKRENILSLLHALQRSNPQNYLEEDDLKLVSSYLSLPLSFVISVATFYSMFSLKPRGKYIIRVCESPPCHLMGSGSLVDALKDLLRIEVGQTTPDGLFTLELSSCLGVCGVAPALMVNEEVYGNLTPEKVRSLINDLRREK